MLRYFLSMFVISLLLTGCSEKESAVSSSGVAGWPVLKHYDANHLSRIALPVGGIGTGTVSISGRGDLVDWEIMNRPAKGFSTLVDGNDAPFFAIYYSEKDKASGLNVKLTVLYGDLEIEKFVLNGTGKVVFDPAVSIKEGASHYIFVKEL